MKTAGVIGIVALAVALQLAFSRFTLGTRWSMDLVLVAVAFVALKWGPGAGIIGGTVGGLAQDALSGTMFGIGGLASTIAGFGVGVIGSQFIVTRPIPRMLVVAGATIVQRLIVMAIISTIALNWSGFSWTGMLAETGLNAVVAFAVFQAMESGPAISRRRGSRRAAFSTRKW